jgi:hypothetical protein
MKIKILTIASLLFFIHESVHSQTVTNQGAPFNNTNVWQFKFDTRTIPSLGASLDEVRFSIALSNNVIIVGSTNFIHCRIDNVSTNGVVLNGSMFMRPAATFVISNNLGQMFFLQPDPSREISSKGTIHCKRHPEHLWLDSEGYYSSESYDNYDWL